MKWFCPVNDLESNWLSVSIDRDYFSLKDSFILEKWCLIFSHLKIASINFSCHRLKMVSFILSLSLFIEFFNLGLVQIQHFREEMGFVWNFQVLMAWQCKSILEAVTDYVTQKFIYCQRKEKFCFANFRISYFSAWFMHINFFVCI